MTVPISSPCISICEMDAGTRLCTGCGRSLDEIAHWTAMDEPRRREIMTGLPARIEAMGNEAAAPARAIAHIRSLLKG